MTRFARTVLILAGAASLAACTTYEPFEGAAPQAARPAYPIQLPPPPPPPPRDPTLPEARPTQPVEARQLPPAATGNQPGFVTPSTPPAPAEPPAPPPRAATALPPPPPVTRTVTRTSVAGKVVDADGKPRTYTVAKGDNLDGIARKMGSTRKELAELNDLKAPYALKPGETLKGPRAKGKAYVVGAGDTMFAIARRFTVAAADLAEENEIGVGATLRVGQKLRLPEGYRDKGPTRTVTQVTEAAPAPPVPRAPATPIPPPRQAAVIPAPSAPTPPAPSAPTRPSTTPAAPAPVRQATAPAPPAAYPVPAAPPRPAGPQVATAPTTIIPSTGSISDSQISQLGRGRFVWPLRGELISTFGPKGTGQRNDGVNIRANPSDVVRAAASGDVVYAGDQVPGFGNLVLVKHTDGWVTAYGHLSRVDVKMQQKIVQGQQIGQAGSTGGVAEPQLHFEVRYAPTPADRARPIDPNLVLPR